MDDNPKNDSFEIKYSSNLKQFNEQDLSYITVEITDMDGIIQPNVSNRLHFKIDGSGVIAGVDNANIKDTDSYVSDTRKAWKGKVLVVIKSTHDAGDIKLTVSSSTLEEKTINIKTVK